jgi:hypothetical protein
MFNHIYYGSGYNPLKGRCRRLNGLDIKTTHHQDIREGSSRDWRINERTQPVFREFHMGFVSMPVATRTVPHRADGQQTN